MTKIYAKSKGTLTFVHYDGKNPEQFLKDNPIFDGRFVVREGQLYDYAIVSDPEEIFPETVDETYFLMVDDSFYRAFDPEDFDKLFKIVEPK